MGRDAPLVVDQFRTLMELEVREENLPWDLDDTERRHSQLYDLLE